MKNNNIMTKSEMIVSTNNPLVNQIIPQKEIKGKVYITYNICETCNLNCVFCCINDMYHSKKTISIKNSDVILNEIKQGGNYA